MTEAIPRAQTFVQPKSQTTTASSNVPAIAITTSSAASNKPPARHHARNVSRHKIEAQRQPVDTTSDKATAAFIRRTLCAHNIHTSNPAVAEKGRGTPKPIEELLPPLTSSNDVDLQLYGIISVVIKEFVQTWYAKITPDHVFVDEIIQIIAHCTRALEQRLREVDLEALLLDEIPALLDAHVAAYRISHHSARHNPLKPKPRQIYHSLHPHPALSPVPVEEEEEEEEDPGSPRERRENEMVWRQLLVQGVLAVLLPTEDLENHCLRVLVTEIFSEMILGGGISGRACESWLLWEGITKIAEVLRPRTAGSDSSEQTSNDESKSEPDLSRLERFGLLSSPEGDGQPVESIESASHEAPAAFSGPFWTIVQYAFLAYTVLRAVFVALAASASYPTRCSTSGGVNTRMVSSSPPDTEAGRQDVAFPVTPSSESWKSDVCGAGKRPIISMRAWWCVSRLLELKVRMPWLAGLCSLLHWGALAGPGKVGDTDGAVDRLLSHHIQTYLLDARHIPPLLRTVRATLFPNNLPAPPRVVPPPEEQAAIRRRCAEALLALISAPMCARFFGCDDPEAWRQEVEDRILDVLSDPYLNRHLMFATVELLVVRLVPELGEEGVKELLEERLG